MRSMPTAARLSKRQTWFLSPSAYITRGSDGADAKLIRLLGIRPGLPASAGSAIWLNGPASPFALTQTPEFAPASSRTATQRRVGVAPAPAIHATSVQISFAPAAPENGATPTCVHAATGPPVRVHSP